MPNIPDEILPLFCEKEV